MSSQVNVHEAKTHLSRLIQRALSGEEIIISRAGKPVVRLVAIESATKKRRQPGTAKGQVTIAFDFDAPLPPDVQKYFEP